MPQWYFHTGTYPAARETMNQFQISETKNRVFFRKRLMSDLTTSKPAFILDSVVPGSFAFTDPQHAGISTFPRLAGFVNQGYSRVTSDESACAVTYLRNDLFEEFSNRYVNPLSVTSGPEASDPQILFNRQFLTDSCSQVWTFSSASNQSGSASAFWDSNSRVKEIWILNSPSKAGLSPAESVTFNFESYAGRLNPPEAVRPNSWPRWTQINLESESVDSLSIFINGEGADATGLSQIALIRKSKIDG